ncbi:MAG: hypothetical protein K6E30_01690 [Lachnospiraceae bacterium]|nr:hypothetical protein [Lachnospiraceae bacterium]
MKKLLASLSIVVLFVCISPNSVFAGDDNERNDDQYKIPVGVIVETTEESLLSKYDFSNLSVSSQRSLVDLSQGYSSFTIGMLNSNASYTTDTYSITKSTIKIGLQSFSGASPNIRVTLYKSNGVSVAVSTVSVPWSNPASGSVTYVSFTNLDTSYDYYAIIKNIGSTQSGMLLGVAMQK